MPSDEQIAEARKNANGFRAGRGGHWDAAILADYIDELTAALRETEKYVPKFAIIARGGDEHSSGAVEYTHISLRDRIDRLLAQWPEGGEG